jgi:hypothetical protein
MASMLRAAGRLFLVGALLLGAGAHWVLLQSAAWTGMALERLRTQDLRSAVAGALDGRHPCGLCLKVREGAGSQSRRQAGASEQKVDFLCGASAAPAAVPAPLWSQAPPAAVPPAPVSPLELPPPRSLPA